MLKVIFVFWSRAYAGVSVSNIVQDTG